MEVNLNNGRSMPIIGLGTFQNKKFEEVEISLDAALSNGYRLIDTAAVYRNEEHVGHCLPDLLKKCNLNRQDIFITTKLGPKDQGAAEARAAVETSLTKLKMDYVDLYLIHWPGKQGLQREDPKNSQQRRESWTTLEDIYLNANKLRAIGVSNYNLEHMKELLSFCKVKPVVLQSEYHPDYQQKDVIEFCRVNNIHFQSYSTLGCGKLVHDARFATVAEKHTKTIPQVLLRWAIQNGCSVIPKSCDKQRIAQNCAIFDFSLCEEDMDEISGSGKNIKYAWDPTTVA